MGWVDRESRQGQSMRQTQALGLPTMEKRERGAFDFDDLVIGSGMGGLSVAALLAKKGRRVGVLEAHDTPGGYAHSFRVKAYRFCAQVHYIFNCGEGESIHNLLTKLKIEDDIPFVRLDPEGFDHIVVAGDRTRIPNGLTKFQGRLVRRFPEAERSLRRYFDIVGLLGRELDRLAVPDRLSVASIRAVFEARHILRYRRWTLEDLYNHVRMPPRLRAILAGQCGDYLLPPRDVSLLLHVALVTLYDRGAYYPKHHYGHFVETIADSIRNKPGCAVFLEHEVNRIETDEKRNVTSVTTTNGKRFTARRYISNVDPRRTSQLAGISSQDGRDRDGGGGGHGGYAYSCGTFTMYLGVRGLDLREHGFGSFNVWHYPHEDINRIYDDQLVRHDLSNPWLFLSTPTLHSDEPGLCPPGDQIIEVATACDYTRFATLRAKDRRAYNLEKKVIRERLLDIIEAQYVPGIRKHLVMRVTGTPATNARFVRAPEGNSYGSALTPANVGPHRRPSRSSALDNLWLVNATAGFPSVAGTIAAGIRLYKELTGDDV
jgi:all-trans-retinol 13,14-reductase